MTPDLGAALGLMERTDAVARPTVRGATVWGTVDDAVVIVEHPNGFGRPELVPAARQAILVLRSGVPRPAAAGNLALASSATVVCSADPAATADGYATATVQACRFALLLRQLPRFRLAHGTPRSPIFVAMFPLDPYRVTSAFAESTHLAAEAIAPRFPDLPGGVLIRVAATASERMLRRQVAVVEKLIRQGE
jgi:hypothetical protein